MYSKVEKSVKESIQNNGTIEFTLDPENYKHGTFMTYVKHSITYVYHRNGTEKLGWFYLSVEKEKRYLMGNFNFTKEYRSGLRTLFFDMIIEKAMFEAEKLSAEKLVIVSMERLLTDTFLNYGFKVGSIDDSTDSGKIVYKGTKYFK